MIKRVSAKEMQMLARQMFGEVVQDLELKIGALKEENDRLREAIIDMNARVKGYENTMRSELSRSEKSRQAILARLAEIENAARKVA